MTRLVLCASLSGGTLLLALLTAIIQSHNRDLGLQLNDLREEATLVEAINAAARAQVIALDHGPLPANDHVAKEKAAR